MNLFYSRRIEFSKKVRKREGESNKTNNIMHFKDCCIHKKKKKNLNN